MKSIENRLLAPYSFLPAKTRPEVQRELRIPKPYDYSREFFLAECRGLLDLIRDAETLDDVRYQLMEHVLRHRVEKAFQKTTITWIIRRIFVKVVSGFLLFRRQKLAG